MKKTTFLAAFALGAAMIVTGCGGGSGNTGGGKVKSNKYLGNVPALHAEYEAEKQAYEDKAQALMIEEKGKEFVKLQNEWEAGEDEREAKFEADLVAEVAKVVAKGVEIPVSYSDALKVSDELFYKVETPAKIIANPEFPDNFIILVRFDVGSVAKRDIEINYLEVDSKGIPFGSSILLGSLSGSMEMVEESIYEGKIYVNGPEYWADFAGIKFCTEAERKTVDEARR